MSSSSKGQSGSDGFGLGRRGHWERTSERGTGAAKTRSLETSESCPNKNVVGGELKTKSRLGSPIEEIFEGASARRRAAFCPAPFSWWWLLWRRGEREEEEQEDQERGG